MLASRYRLCLFDAYGTLFDLSSVAQRSAARLGERAPALLALWRQKQLEYTWLRTLMQRHAPFDQVTADALHHALESLGISDSDLAGELLAGYLSVAPYPEVPATLAALEQAGIARGILSNGTPAMLNGALRASGLEFYFRHVLSVESVGCYKPDPRVYALAVSETGTSLEEIVFVSANAWDVAGAASFGLRVVWVNRTRAGSERLPGAPVATISSLADLPGSLADCDVVVPNEAK
ncbi:MAG TPA: haloacid dehalogenase type II [Isosphaeraceae bacterium]|nr:haloacid dehalogenase type II [Isosphaeraceae bacterium]